MKLHLGAEDEVVDGFGGDGDEVWGVIPSLSLFHFQTLTALTFTFRKAKRLKM